VTKKTFRENLGEPDDEVEEEPKDWAGEQKTAVETRDQIPEFS
jgi:hypothetical protein